MIIPFPSFPKLHPLCVTCRHLYGRTHGGVVLVCAMHPTGPDGDTCEDHQRLSPTAKPTTRTLPNQGFLPNAS